MQTMRIKNNNMAIIMTPTARTHPLTEIVRFVNCRNTWQYFFSPSILSTGLQRNQNRRIQTHRKCRRQICNVFFPITIEVHWVLPINNKTRKMQRINLFDPVVFFIILIVNVQLDKMSHILSNVLQVQCKSKSGGD